MFCTRAPTTLTSHYATGNAWSTGVAMLESYSGNDTINTLSMGVDNETKRMPAT